MNRILIVEDDDALREGISYALKKEGFLTETASHLQGLDARLAEDIDAVLLDVSLPDGDSRDYLSELRRKNPVPVIFLTARSTEQDMIRGFDAGGDDYIAKPFSIPLLVRRLKAVLKRAGETASSRYCAGNLTYDFEKKLLLKDGKEIVLSRTEGKLLEALIRNRNQVLTAEILLDRIWDVDGNFVDKNTLSVNISRLREKIEEDKRSPRWIRTVFGIGYKWEDRE